MDEKIKQSPSEHAKVVKAAGIVGGATLLSRVFGYVRDMVFASYFGAGISSDAFIAAFRLPNLLRRLFGEGSLSIAFVPVFTEYLADNGKKEAYAFASSAFWMLALVLSGIALLCVFSTPLIVKGIAGGFSAVPGKYELTVRLARILFPYIFFIGLVALCMGILNTLGHFAAPAFAPVFLNFGMILAMIAGGALHASPFGRIEMLAYGVIIGGGMQLFLQMPFIVGKGISLFRNIRLYHPGLKRVAQLMGPSILGASVYQINIVIGTLLASLLASGSVSYLYYADRLVQFPLALFAHSTATAVLPSLSRLASRKSWETFYETLTYGLNLVFLVNIPATVGLLILNKPMIRILFERGDFDMQATDRTAEALFYYGIGLWAFSAVRIVASAFYAIQDTRTPVRVAIVSIVFNLVLGMLLMIPLSHGGLALATSLSSMLNFALLLYFLTRRKNSIRWRQIGVCIVKTGMASVLMGAAVYHLSHVLPVSGEQSILLSAFCFLGCIASGILIFTISCYLLRISEFTKVISIVLRRR